MSIVIIAFSNAPKVSPEALQREKKLDEMLEKKVHGTLMQSRLSQLWSASSAAALFAAGTRIFHHRVFFTLLNVDILSREEAPTKQIISYVMHMLSQEDDIDGLPPGGGLVSKWVIAALWLWRLHSCCSCCAVRSVCWTITLSLQMVKSRGNSEENKTFSSTWRKFCLFSECITTTRKHSSFIFFRIENEL